MIERVIPAQAGSQGVLLVLVIPAKRGTQASRDAVARKAGIQEFATTALDSGSRDARPE